MATTLKDAINRKRWLLENEDALLDKARKLYKQGFCPTRPKQPRISAAQMAAVEERIQIAVSFNDAVDNVNKFLSKQLQKLRAREERTGKAESWQQPSETEDKPLGEILKNYIAQQSYLPPNSKLDEISRLDLLRRFWSYFHGLYRYERKLNSPMVLPESLDKSSSEKAK